MLCRSVKYLQIVGMFASSYMIVAMTVDRHHAICCPLQAYRGGAMSRWNTPVMVAWALALILSIPQVGAGERKHEKKSYLSHKHKIKRTVRSVGFQADGVSSILIAVVVLTRLFFFFFFCRWAYQMFIFSRSEVAPGEFECWGHFAEQWGLKAYVTWMTIAVFLLPALIITVCQVTLSELTRGFCKSPFINTNLLNHKLYTAEIQE